MNLETKGEKKKLENLISGLRGDIVEGIQQRHSLGSGVLLSLEQMRLSLLNISGASCPREKNQS